ncbi:hypothetical protein [Amycolatopsis sp. H20-H5]|uniref:hypothetical protein n=1 Tax=Amycolatopsis sp. H20-H5 TaxID=3046309 RepID=UPI002DBD8F75|nr:hypothetical protein [Amycolatopsis sp. H20-H5]MEC3980225.1 hypothetical protein [Amycolatopsis sp. H20-H5]
MKRRPTTILCWAGAVLALATACGQARAGTAVPRGDEATAYVGAKFENTMNKMKDTVGDQRNVTTSLDAYFRFDDKWVHNLITAARTGDPESRVSRNHSQKNPDEALDSFTPGEGTVEYMYLGPAYKSLAPTPWVSMPKPETGMLNKCNWAGIQVACKMGDAVAVSYNKDKKTVKGAKSLPDGKTELTADVTFDSFVSNRVEVLPESITSKIKDELHKAVVPTKVTVNADGTLDQIVMDAKFEGDGHKVELRYTFAFTGKASTQDLPKTPDAAQVTVLPDKAARDDFYRRLGDLQ